MTETPLDLAHAAMMAAPEDDTARMRFFERLADNELFLLLEREAEGDQITPRVFELDEPVVLVFDREERLAEFAGAVPYVALSGRVVAGMLDGQGMGLGVNLDVAPSAIIIPSQGVSWLAQMVAAAPTEVEEKPEELSAPGNLPEDLLRGLDTKLGSAGGFARFAYLCAVRYQTGRNTHLLAFVDPVPGSEPALARAVAEALVFTGLDAGELDVAFFAASDPVAATLARVGLRFDLPQAAPKAAPEPPGSNPNKPPILK